MLILFPGGQQRSGKLGSLTFSKRGYVSPTKLHSLPKNSVNTIVQSRFQLLNSGYRDACVAVAGFKLAWDNYSIVVSNRVGTLITLTGKAAFIRINMNLILSGQSPIEFPDVNSVAPVINDFRLQIISHSHVFNVYMIPDSSLTAVNVFASPCFSTGKVAANANMFRKIATINNSVTSPNSVSANYSGIFGRLRNLARISVYVQAISPGGIPSSIHQINRVVN